MLLSVGAFLQSCTQQKKEISQDKTQQMKTIYDYKVESLDGKEINFADFKGKKILIVNTASECGFTPQYADLETLSNDYKDKLVVVGFPANNFGGQNLEAMLKLCRSVKKIMASLFRWLQKFL